MNDPQKTNKHSLPLSEHLRNAGRVFGTIPPGGKHPTGHGWRNPPVSFDVAAAHLARFEVDGRPAAPTFTNTERKAAQPSLFDLAVTP